MIGFGEKWREKNGGMRAAIFCINTMTNEEILQGVLSVLAIDGQLDPRELQFFDTLCQKLELPPEKRQNLLDDITQGKGQIYVPEEKEEREQLLLYLLQAAFADGKLAPQEKRIIQSAAHKMGIEQKVLEKQFQMK